MSEKYSCSLSEKWLDKAKKELNEIPDERQGAVQALKEWADREPWITAPPGSYFNTNQLEPEHDKTYISYLQPRVFVLRSMCSKRPKDM